MYKKLLFVAIAIFTLSKANAQLKMEVGTTDIFFRAGAPFLQTSKFSEPTLEDFKAQAPAIGLGYETGLFADNISVGLEINYATFKNNTTSVQSGSVSGTVGHYYGDMTIINFEIFAKYYTPLKFGKLATYVRADLLPFAIYKSNRTSDFSTGAQLFSNQNGVKMTYGVYAGANYQLAGPLAAFAEIGYGYTAINAGISLRIGN